MPTDKSSEELVDSDLSLALALARCLAINRCISSLLCFLPLARFFEDDLRAGGFGGFGSFGCAPNSSTTPPALFLAEGDNGCLGLLD